MPPKGGTTSILFRRLDPQVGRSVALTRNQVGNKKNQVRNGKNDDNQTGLPTLFSFCPQIAIVLGVLLTSNRGEGDEPLWRNAPGTRVPLHGAVDVVPLLGAIVPLWRAMVGGVDVPLFSGVDVVPLLGAIAGCHSSVLWLGGVTTK